MEMGHGMETVITVAIVATAILIAHYLVVKKIEVVGHHTTDRISSVLGDVQASIDNIASRMATMEADFDNLHKRVEYLEERDRDRK